MRLKSFKPLSRHPGRPPRWAVIVLAGAIVLILAAVGSWAVARPMLRRGWPQTAGTLTLAGLNAPVTVARDQYGVPHIYAENPQDLFFAQGYVHAQDRFWQMEQSRRRGSGTLAAVLGEATQEQDRRWQNLGLLQIAAQELEQMDAVTRASFDAYAAGVNAWLNQTEAQLEQLPFEYTLLRWRDRDYKDPAPWTVTDSLLVALALGWQTGGSHLDPTLTAQITERVGQERARFLLGTQATATTNGIQAPTNMTQTTPGRWALRTQVTLVSGDCTESGAMLLAIDLPTDLSLPAPWYVLAWYTGEKAAAGPSAPGVPGLLLGTDEGAIWETWPESQELALNPDTPAWKRWLFAALLNSDNITYIDDDLDLDDDQPPRTVKALQQRQQDTFSARAARLIPLLVQQVEPKGWRQERVTGMLQKWDYDVSDNNKEAPFFVVYQLELARAALADELGATLFEDYVAHSNHYQAVLDQIIANPDDPWWDDVTTPEWELRGDILKRAYAPALEWIGRRYGDLHMLWEWDIVHSSQLHHPLGDAWPWDQLLNRDIAPDGWSDTVNASPGGLLCTDGICQSGDIFRAKAVYGYRQILNLADPSTLWFILLPGQSGQPFHPHYDDLMDEWLDGEYIPLKLVASPQEIEGVESVLSMRPGD